MTMSEFAEIIKNSKIAGNNKAKIIYKLFKVLGAQSARSDAADGYLEREPEESPSDSTIKSWFGKKKLNIKAKIYFRDNKIEKEEEAHNFLRNTPKENQWLELRDLFREWFISNQNGNKEFYIETETEDFTTFSISFWRQFASYFDSLRLWDNAYPETKKNSWDGVADKMLYVFKESFIQYKVCDFVPIDINIIIDSLSIYSKGVNEIKQKVTVLENGAVQRMRFKRMYCKWSLAYDFFMFCELISCGGFWRMEAADKSILLKFDESFDYEKVMTNEWLTGVLNYAFVDHNIHSETQVDDEMLSWKECQGKIIVFDIDFPNDIDGDYPIIEDCYALIDEMFEQKDGIDEFIAVVSEKIIKKYGGLTFDNNSRLLYNDINQYIESLVKFKEYLARFRNLEKEKSQYLSDQMFVKAFGMYPAFSDYEVSPKPIFPFSECYLDLDESRKVQSELCRCHKNLIELYAEIVEYEGMVGHK